MSFWFILNPTICLFPIPHPYLLSPMVSLLEYKGSRVIAPNPVSKEWLWISDLGLRPQSHFEFLGCELRVDQLYHMHSCYTTENLKYLNMKHLFILGGPFQEVPIGKLVSRPSSQKYRPKQVTISPENILHANFWMYLPSDKSPFFFFFPLKRRGV